MARDLFADDSYESEIGFEDADDYEDDPLPPKPLAASPTTPLPVAAEPRESLDSRVTPNAKLRTRPMPPRLRAKWPDVVTLLLTNADGSQILFFRRK